jgi:adenosylcobyric acid synthase
MVQGVSSGAGKSLLTCALCRSLARRGVRVAPFKAQNMSNNARVVEGGEIGTAQWLQAQAAGVAPDVRMNPVLLKPEAETRSQVVVMGKVDHELTRAPWRGRSGRLRPVVEAAYRSLRAEHDVVVLEGAGSPAETNLWADDIVNMAMAEVADAAVVLVADIDRGGAFAHLYGTWALLPERWRGRIAGFVLNKFRGDVTLLDPAPADLEARTGVPTVGVVPWLDHRLPDEEGPSLRSVRRSVGGGAATGAPAPAVQVALVCGPAASNLDEFARLQQVADVRLVGAGTDLGDVDLVVLPGSKHVAADLAWLRRTGLAEAVVRAAGSGVPVLGVCGGLQALGTSIDDPAGIEAPATGLGVLPVATTFGEAKRTVHTSATFAELPEPWGWLSRRPVAGYEIRHGRTLATGDGVSPVLPDGLGFAAGNLLGVYLHGLLEDDEVLAALTGQVPEPLDAAFDALADAFDDAVDPGWVDALLAGGRP